MRSLVNWDSVGRYLESQELLQGSEGLVDENRMNGGGALLEAGARVERGGTSYYLQLPRCRFGRFCSPERWSRPGVFP